MTDGDSDDKPEVLAVVDEEEDGVSEKEPVAVDEGIEDAVPGLVAEVEGLAKALPVATNDQELHPVKDPMDGTEEVDATLDGEEDKDT